MTNNMWQLLLNLDSGIWRSFLCFWKTSAIVGMLLHLYFFLYLHHKLQFDIDVGSDYQSSMSLNISFIFPSVCIFELQFLPFCLPIYYFSLRWHQSVAWPINMVYKTKNYSFFYKFYLLFFRSAWLILINFFPSTRFQFNC